MRPSNAPWVCGNVPQGHFFSLGRFFLLWRFLPWGDPDRGGSRTAPAITRERLLTSRLPAAMRYNGQKTDSSQDKGFTFHFMKVSFDEGHDHGISKVPAMERMIFRIKGMCCGEEISVLKRELAPIVGGELFFRRKTVSARRRSGKSLRERAWKPFHGQPAARRVSARWKKACGNGVDGSSCAC